MRHSNLNFISIERAITFSIKALEMTCDDEKTNENALRNMDLAKEDYKRALSISMSRINGH